jgi:hypothetical protein
MKNNADFAHPENILVAILRNSSERVRKIAVNRIMCLRRKSNEQSEVRKFEIAISKLVHTNKCLTSMEMVRKHLH